MTIVIYGIPNCDTVKKARNWLESKDVAFRFHDFRKDGLCESELRNWVSTHGLDIVLNKRGTTFRKLPDDVKDNLTEDAAIALMLDQPAMIKRPVFDFGNGVTRVGFAKKDMDDLESLVP